MPAIPVMRQVRQPADSYDPVLEQLASGERMKRPAVVVVAHPDDETLGMAARLSAFSDLTIVQLTDGAPRDARDATRLGFADCAAYAAEREREAEAALAALGVSCRRVHLGAPDQETVFLLERLLPPVEDALIGADLVLSHPYEGGHPDHDSAALLVQLACARLSRIGLAPPRRLEFASYHHRDGRMVTGQFWHDPACREIAIPLDENAQARKRRALTEYRSQADVIKWFSIAVERYRVAPWYDFSRPAPPQIAQYDLFGWSLTASRWREAAAAALTLLGEEPS